MSVYKMAAVKRPRLPEEVEPTKRQRPDEPTIRVHLHVEDIDNPVRLVIKVNNRSTMHAFLDLEDYYKPRRVWGEDAKVNYPQLSEWALEQGYDIPSDMGARTGTVVGDIDTRMNDTESEHVMRVFIMRTATLKRRDPPVTAVQLITSMIENAPSRWWSIKLERAIALLYLRIPPTERHRINRLALKHNRVEAIRSTFTISQSEIESFITDLNERNRKEYDSALFLALEYGRRSIVLESARRGGKARLIKMLDMYHKHDIDYDWERIMPRYVQ